MEQKEQYNAPQLQCYGNLRELTQTVGSNTAMKQDNGGGDTKHRTA